MKQKIRVLLKDYRDSYFYENNNIIIYKNFYKITSILSLYYNLSERMQSITEVKYKIYAK